MNAYKILILHLYQIFLIEYPDNYLTIFSKNNETLRGTISGKNEFLRL